MDIVRNFPYQHFERIPQHHPVRLVEKVVNLFDIIEWAALRLIKKYKGGVTSAYYPYMILKVLFYSDLPDIYSCRKIARALAENIHMMYLSANSTLDFRTINDFRR